MKLWDTPDHKFNGIKVFVKEWMPKDKILFISKLTHPEGDKENEKWIIKNVTAKAK